MSISDVQVNTEKKPHRWGPNNTANLLGRPKGSRNKLGEAFLAAMHADFQAHGQAVIVEVRETNPSQYLKVIASILPKQFELDASALGQFSDEHLAQLVTALDAWLAQNGEAGNTETFGRNKVIEIQPVLEAERVPHGGKP